MLKRQQSIIFSQQSNLPIIQLPSFPKLLLHQFSLQKCHPTSNSCSFHHPDHSGAVETLGSHLLCFGRGEFRGAAAAVACGGRCMGGSGAMGCCHLGCNLCGIGWVGEACVSCMHWINWNEVKRGVQWLGAEYFQILRDGTVAMWEELGWASGAPVMRPPPCRKRCSWSRGSQEWSTHKPPQVLQCPMSQTLGIVLEKRFARLFVLMPPRIWDLLPHVPVGSGATMSPPVWVIWLVICADQPAEVVQLPVTSYAALKDPLVQFNIAWKTA